MHPARRSAGGPWSRLTIPAAALALAFALPAEAAFEVYADTALSLFAAGGPTESDSQTLGPVAALRVTLDPIDLVSDGDSSRATATMRGTAALGELSLYAAYTAESFGAGGEGAGVFLHRTTLSWYDRATILHPTLPAGTPVELRARLALSGPFAAVRMGNAISTGLARAGASGGNVHGSYSFVIEETVAAAAPSRVLEDVFTALVGDTIPLQGGLYVTIGGDAIRGGFSSITADFSSTARFTLVPVTPGVSYVTDSGLSFVPIPAGVWLLGSGLAAVAGLGRQRGRRHP